MNITRLDLASLHAFADKHFEECQNLQNSHERLLEKVKENREEEEDWQNLIDFLSQYDDNASNLRTIKYEIENKDGKELKAAKLYFYKVILDQLIEAGRSIKQEEVQDEDRLCYIHQQFRFYYIAYKNEYVCDLEFLPPIHFITEKYYADRGYSMWASLKDFFKSESNITNTITFQSVIQTNANEFLSWLNKNPKTASNLIGDLRLLTSIISDENLLQKIESTLQANIITLTFLDAMGLCKEEPFINKEEFKFKALAEFISHLPTGITLTKHALKLAQSCNLFLDVIKAVIEIYANFTIQKLNHNLDIETKKKALLAVQILRAPNINKWIQDERDYRLAQIAGLAKQTLESPEDVFNHLIFHGKLWFETIRQATETEKKTRLFVQVLFPLIGVLGTFSYLATRATYHVFSVSLSIVLLGMVGRLTLFFYSWLNRMYRDSYRVIENQVRNQLASLEWVQKDNNIRRLLERNFEEEVGVLQKMYQLLKIPDRYLAQREDSKHHVIIEKLYQHFEKSLNARKDKEELTVEKSIKLFNEVFECSKIKKYLTSLVEQISLDYEFEENNPLKFIKEEFADFIKKSQDKAALEYVDDILFSLANRLIHTWLKDQFVSYWENHLSDTRYTLPPRNSFKDNIKTAFRGPQLHKLYKCLIKHA